LLGLVTNLNLNLNANIDPNAPDPWSGASLTPEQIMARVLLRSRRVVDVVDAQTVDAVDTADTRTVDGPLTAQPTVDSVQPLTERSASPAPLTEDKPRRLPRSAFIVGAPQ
jgi:hypothetical protein